MDYPSLLKTSKTCGSCWFSIWYD